MSADDTAPSPARKSGPLQKLLPWAITIACFAYLYFQINAQAARQGESAIGFLAGVFANVSWVNWLALMIPYSAFFFLIDSLVVWRIVNWFNAKVPYTDILPIRGSAYIISILNEQIGKGVMAVYLNRRDGVPGWQVGSSMLFIMFCEFFYLLFWANIGYALRGDQLPPIFPADITQNEMLAAIQAINVNPRITGIILQRPIPRHLNLEQLQFAISPSKDVEGMHPANIGKIVYGNFEMGPCTAIASVEILKSTGLTLRGLDCVVVGHSEIVGKPIAFYLLEELATVTICHHGTRNLANFTRQADAVFVAVGKPGLITADMVKPGAVVIDIGINSIEVVDDEGNKKHKTVGDVDFGPVHEVAGWITPVPGGVGPVTLSILVRNTVVSAEHQQQAYERTMRIGFS